MNFETLYQVHEHPWGSLPEKAIERFLSLLKVGSVLDAGSGDGRNALFLAEQGFTVTALDIAPAAITTLLAQAEQRGVVEQVTGICADLADFSPDCGYDNVISGFTLHFLSKATFPVVLKRLQETTTLGGVNVIMDFTQDGPLYKPETSRYWLSLGELLQLYTGWEIIHYEEGATKTRATDEHGNSFTQGTATIVARKI